MSPAWRTPCLPPAVRGGRGRVPHEEDQGLHPEEILRRAQLPQPDQPQDQEQYWWKQREQRRGLLHLHLRLLQAGWFSGKLHPARADPQHQQEAQEETAIVQVSAGSLSGELRSLHPGSLPLSEV